MTSRSGLTTYSVRESVGQIRVILTHKMDQESCNVKLGSGLNIAVLIDETYFTKPKRNGAGFAGRQTAGHKTKVLEGIEIDLTTRLFTGFIFMVFIPNCTRALILAEIFKIVALGALIWTNGHKSYQWLGAGVTRGQLSPTSGYRWDWVSHKRSTWSHVHKCC
jgi:hypothetical protein